MRSWGTCKCLQTTTPTCRPRARLTLAAGLLVASWVSYLHTGGCVNAALKQQQLQLHLPFNIV